MNKEEYLNKLTQTVLFRTTDYKALLQFIFQKHLKRQYFFQVTPIKLT